MENRAHAIIAVTFLLVFSIGAVLVWYWLANRHNETMPYQIVTTESVGGLSAQSEVQFKGIVVGHITHIGFDPADRARVVIRIQLQPQTYVTHATYAEVAMQGLTGGSVLELKLGTGSRAPLATSQAHPARIPMHAGMLGSLMASARTSMQELQQVLAAAHQVLDADNRAHLAATLAQLDTSTRRLAALEARMPKLLAGMQQSVDASHALIANSNALAEAAQRPVRNAASLEASIQALAQSSQRLSDQLNRQTAPDFNALSQSLLQTSQQMNALLRELQAKPQSLIFGAPKPPPGPGEPGFDAGHPEHQP